MNAPIEHIPFGIPVEVECRRVQTDGVRVEVVYDGHVLEARLLRGVSLRAGDHALLIKAAGGQNYITGCIGGVGPSEDADTPPADADVPPLHLVLSDGTSVSREQADTTDTLRVFAPDGRLLFSHDCAASQSTLRLGDSDVCIEAGGVLTLSGEAGTTIASPGEVRVECAALEVEAAEASMSFDRIKTRAKMLLANVDHHKAVVDLLETTAGRIVERAKDTLRETEGLTQIRAGRLRWFAERTLHTFAERTILVSRTDTKLKANRVHLG